MPVEIREIVIKTEVRNGIKPKGSFLEMEDWLEFRKQLLSDCQKMIKDKTKAKRNKR